MVKDTDYKKLWRKADQIVKDQMQFIAFFKSKVELSVNFCREKLSASDFKDYLKLLGLKEKEENPEEKPKTELILPERKIIT